MSQSLQQLIAANERRTTPMSAQLDSLLKHVVSAHKIPSAQVNLESIDDVGYDQITDTMAAVTNAINSIPTTTGIEYTPASMQAAGLAALASINMEEFIQTPISVNSGGTGVTLLKSLNISDAFNTRSNAEINMEAYDSSANKNSQVYSIAYNLNSSRQDEFGETLFPTVTVAHNEAGLTYEITQMTVQRNKIHGVTGELMDLGKRPILRGYADATVLADDTNVVVPVVRPGQNDDSFIDPAIIAPTSVTVDGETVDTAPLVTNKRINLIGLSQTDGLLANGSMDKTDSLDPALLVKKVYLAVTNGADTDIVSIDLNMYPTNNFTYTPQGESREMVLSFNSESVILKDSVTQVDGSPLVALVDMASNNISFRLGMVINGNANLESGTVSVYGNEVRVVSAADANGDNIDLTHASIALMVDAINAGELIGWVPDALRTNSNLRQTGRLLDAKTTVAIANIPLRSPITALRPVGAANGDDSDLRALITATGITTSNSAVTKLLETANILQGFTSVNTADGASPEILGVGSHYVKPYFERNVIDVSTEINSLSSSTRGDDITGVLYGYIRHAVYEMYSVSEFQAGMRAIYGNNNMKPTVIVATDNVIARYLSDNDTFAKLGGGFDVKVVATNDTRMAGKIAITFGVFDGNQNKRGNPLHFGNMGWAPEVTVVLPVTRGGSTSKNLVVTPRYLHIVNLPVLTMMEVSGIPDSLGRVAVNHHAV